MTTMPLFDRATQGRNQRFGVGRCDHNRVDAAGGHFFDQGHLPTQVSFILDPIDDQIVLIGVLALMRFRPLRHRGKELIGQRLHDQGHARLR